MNCTHFARFIARRGRLKILLETYLSLWQQNKKIWKILPLEINHKYVPLKRVYFGH